MHGKTAFSVLIGILLAIAPHHASCQGFESFLPLIGTKDKLREEQAQLVAGEDDAGVKRALMNTEGCNLWGWGLARLGRGSCR